MPRRYRTTSSGLMGPTSTGSSTTTASVRPAAASACASDSVVPTASACRCMSTYQLGRTNPWASATSVDCALGHCSLVGEDRDQHAAPGPADTSELGQTRHRVREVVDHEGGHDDVEGAGPERQGSDVTGDRRADRPCTGRHVERAVRRHDVGTLLAQGVARHAGPGSRVQGQCSPKARRRQPSDQVARERPVDERRVGRPGDCHPGVRTSRSVARELTATGHRPWRPLPTTAARPGRQRPSPSPNTAAMPSRLSPS